MKIAFGTIVEIIKKYRVRLLLSELSRRIYSEKETYVFRLDFKESKMAESRLPIRITRVSAECAKEALWLNEDNIADQDFKARLQRTLYLDSKLGECYVALTMGNEICHLHWLFSQNDNSRLAKYFRNGFFELGEKEYLFEGGFTPKRFRGKGIMPHAMWKIAYDHDRNGIYFGFVDSTNTSSIMGMRKAGYKEYLLRNEKWRFFRRTLTLTQM